MEDGDGVICLTWCGTTLRRRANSSYHGQRQRSSGTSPRESCIITASRCMGSGQTMWRTVTPVTVSVTVGGSSRHGGLVTPEHVGL